MPLNAVHRRGEVCAIVALAAPLAGANLAQMAMGLTNTVMVGHLGGASLAAAGLGGAFYFTLMLICQGVLTAVAPLAAHAIGARDPESAGRVAGGGVLLAVLLALPMLGLLTVAPRLLGWIGYDAALAAGIEQYLSAIRWGSPAFLGLVVLRAILSANSDVRPVMIVLMLGVPANAALNCSLVFGHLGLPALGIVGSGCSTAIIQWLMMLSVAGYAAFAGPRFRVPTTRVLLRIVRIGLPISGLIAMEVGVFNASGVLMGILGADALAAHQLAINFSSLTFMVPLGIAQAATVTVAARLGAGQIDAARRAGFIALALGGGLMLAPSILMLTAPHGITRIYLDTGDPANQATAAIAVQLLAIAAAFQVFDGIQVIAVGALRGYRDTAVPMLIGAVGYWGVGFAGGWTLAFPLGYGAAGLWCGMALGLATVALLLTWRFYTRSRAGAGKAALSVAQPA